MSSAEAKSGRRSGCLMEAVLS